MYTGGKALPVTQAKLRVGGSEFETAIGPEDAGAVFKVTMARGQTHLQTWLTDDKGLEVGAYYVYVRVLETR